MKDWQTKDNFINYNSALKPFPFPSQNANSVKAVKMNLINRISPVSKR